MSSYKQQKEAFVSGLTGGTVGEVNAVLFVTMVSVALWSVLQSRQYFFHSYGPLAFGVDYFLNVVTILLAVTLYSNQLLLLCLLIAAPALLIYVLPQNHSSSRKKPKVPPQNDPKKGAKQLDPIPLKPFLTTYRSVMLISTCVAILAVDYRLFPRRFAKVETWGTSFMDMGVGSFVFTGGLVGVRPMLKEKAAGRSIPVISRVIGSLRHSIPLLVLGLVRLMSVKGLDYAEHVTEYGVHWNFFFTLGLLPPFIAAAQGALAFVPSYAALALLISGTYQVLLETTSLKAFILTAPRINLFSMNREGIFSFLGYLAIFLAGQDYGRLALPRKTDPKSTASASTQRKTLLLKLGVWVIIWWGLYSFSTSYKYGLALSVSRRLANLPYVLWVAAFNSSTVLAFAIVDSVFFPAVYSATDSKTEKEVYLTATSPILRAFNRNGLAMFLAGNLLTGLVNLTTDTLNATPVMTMAVLLAYTASLSILAVMLDTYNISIKF